MTGDVRYHLFSDTRCARYACLGCEVSWPLADGRTCWMCGRGELARTYREWEEERYAAKRAAERERERLDGCPCSDCHRHRTTREEGST